jgi:hypothetical protein
MNWTLLVVAPSAQDAPFRVSVEFGVVFPTPLHSDCTAYLEGESVVEWHTAIPHQWPVTSTVLVHAMPCATFSLDKSVLKRRRDTLIARCATIENKK